MFDLDEEEKKIILSHRYQKKFDYNSRQKIESHGDCKHLTYDSEGDHCKINLGFGVGDHFFDGHGRFCEQYEAKED